MVGFNVMRRGNGGAISDRRSALMLGTALTAAALSGVVLVGLSSPVVAADQFWEAPADGNGTTVDGGTGTWDVGVTPNWTDAADTTQDTWTNGNTANFGGTAGTVTVDNAAGGQVTIDGMNFTTSGYTITGDGLLLSAGSTINANVATTNINVAIDGAQALAVNSNGTVNFGGAIGGTTPLTSFTTDAGGVTGLNGGAVTTTGVQTYNDAVVMGANTTLTTTNSTVTFNDTVNGAFGLTTSTGTAATVFNGVVGGTTALASLSTGVTTINTTGITTTGTQSYGGAVTLSSNTTLTTTNSNVTFDSTVNGAFGLTTSTGTGSTVFNGVVGGTTALASLSTGPATINTTAITTTGTQSFSGAVTLGSNTTLTTTNSDVTFGSTVNGAFGLTTSTGTGATVFNGVVGGTTALASLSTSGATSINTTGITTSGTQTYGGAVTLGADATLAGVGITFNSTVNGAQSLTVTDSGTTTFNGAVGGTTPLTSLTTNGGGTTAINTAAITTSGAQTYSDAVTLGANTTLSGVNVTFGSTVNGAQTLTVTDSGTTTFSGIVGGTTPLTSLTTNGGGTTAINTTAITTTGAQTYSDAVTLGATATLTSTGNAAINLASTVDGAFGLTVNTTGTTTFGGAVGATTALASLTTNAGGTTAINGGSVRTSGDQNYNDAVTLGAATTLTSTTGAINAATTVNNGGFLLTVNNATTGTFAGAISGGGGLTKQGAGTITLSAANTYTGPTTVSAGTLTISGTGSITSNVTNDATFNNNGTVTGSVTNNAPGTATNTGTITAGVANAGGFTNSGTVNGSLINSGTYTQTAGSTNGGTTNTGTINANAGAFNGVIANNAGSFNVGGAVTSDNTFNNNGAALNINTGSYTIAGDLNNTGTVLIGAPATLNVTGNINATGGSITNNGTVNDDLFNFAPSVITNNNIWNGNVATNTGTITNSFGATWNGNVASNTGTINGFGTWNGNVSNSGLWNAFLPSPGGATTVNGTFANNGTISLVDGDTQDVMTINGGLSGTGAINMDIDLGGAGVPATGQRSDQVVVVGNYTGATTFNFTPTSNTRSLQPPILVANFDDAQPNPGTATATGLGGGGLVQYSLTKIGQDYYVVSAPNLAAVGGIAGNIAIVQATIGAIVNRPSSPFVSGLAADVEPNYCGAGPWMRATGGGVKATGTTTSPISAAATADVSLAYAGAQFGLDLACFNVKESGLDVAAGVIGGGNAGISSQPVPNAGTTDASFQQGFGGVYATVAKGQFSADLQARVDFTQYSFNNPQIQLSNAGLSTVRGTLSGSASYAIPVTKVEGLNLVPTAGFSFSRTTASTLTFDTGQTLTPDPSLSLMGFIGATVAKTIVLPDEVSAITPFATATGYNDFAADPTAVFFDPGTNQSATVTSNNLGMIGEVSLGMNYVKILEGDGPKQINATIRADARFSNRVLGAGVTGQVRAQF